MTTTGQEVLAELTAIAQHLRDLGFGERAGWVDRAADHIEFLETDMKTDTIDAVDWDDRKQILDVFQDTKPGTVTMDGGLYDLYDKLMAVARWGAQQAFERMTEGRPLQPTPSAEPDVWADIAASVDRKRMSARQDAAPPSIANMAPGTTFSAVTHGEGVQSRRTFTRSDDFEGGYFESQSGGPYFPRDIDPSTIRDVVPPKERP